MMRYNQPHPDEQMPMDNSCELYNVTYNRHGLPTRVTFSDGSIVDYVYSFSGKLKSMKAYSKPVNAQGVTQITAMRDYCGDFIFENGTLSMVNFPGGYFDSDGNPNYRHTDWQGNVTIVTNSEGKIAQHTGYYPYGEPWSEPSGQPYLYGGKERLREGALNEYDFGARRYNSALALWTTPDPKSAHIPGMNPYVNCNANPIKFIDPTGEKGRLVVENNALTFQATFYATTKSIDSAKYAASLVNDLSKQITFEMKDESESIVSMDLVFEINVVEVEYTGGREESDVNFPVQQDDNGNAFIVVNDKEMNDDNLNGQSGYGLAKIRESRSQTESAGHEMLHCLGFLHHLTGIMTASSTDRNRNMSLDKKGTLKDVKSLFKKKTNNSGIKIDITDDMIERLKNMKLKEDKK